MPQTILDTSKAGLTSDWDIVGPVPGWEAVRRGSGDTLLARSQTLNHKFSYECGTGFAPPYGMIPAVTIHFRCRQTVAGAGSVLNFMFIRNGIELFGFPAVALTTSSWVEASFRLRSDWLTAGRFTQGGVGEIGVGAQVWLAPATGWVEVSEIWCTVEYLATDTTYDPMDGTLPAAIVGDEVWALNGTQPNAITAAPEYLDLADASAVDYVSFTRADIVLPEQYVTDLETFLDFYSLAALSLPNQVLYYIAALDTGDKSVHLVLSILDHQYQLGLIGAGLNYLDASAYLALYPVPTILSGGEVHFHLEIDRDDTPSSLGYVKVFLDFSDTPVMEVVYDYFPTTAVNRILWGTGDPTTGLTSADCSVYVDYFSWHNKRKRGYTFGSWEELVQSDNVVEADSLDDYVWSPVVIPPSNIVAGQSDYCCKLLHNTYADLCYVKQFWTMLEITPVTYDLTIDYRMDLIGYNEQVSVQRVRDHWYWDEGTQLWQSAPSYAALPNSPTRTRLALMTNIGSGVAEVLIVSIGRIVAAAPGTAHNTMIYKAGLERT